MELTEDRINEKYAENCGCCNRKTLLLYEWEFICFSCEYNVIKRKPEFSKIQRIKNKFYQQTQIC